MSLEGELLRVYLVRQPQRWIDPRSSLGSLAARGLFRLAQRATERRHYRVRRDLLRLDEQLENVLAFSGKGK